MLSFRIYVATCATLLALNSGVSHADESVGKETNAQSPTTAKEIILTPEGLPSTWLQGSPVDKWEKDKIYIFEFWATWCGPCLAAMPHMEELYQAFKENPQLKIVGVNVMDRKTQEELKAFLKARPTPLNYTMAFDANGNTVKNWLTPLNVTGIPHAFAIKNGKLIWRGHPSSLSLPFIESMLNSNSSAKGTNQGAVFSPVDTNKVLRSVEKSLYRLLSEGKLDEATALIKETEGKKNLPTANIIYLKSIPFEILARQGKITEAQISLAKLAEEYPDNYNVQMSIADDVMNSQLIPVDQKDTDLVEQCLRKGIEISKSKNREASLPWNMLAQLKSRYGKHEEALDCMEKALQLSSIGKAWEDLQKNTDNKRPFLDVLKNVSSNLPVVKERTAQVLGPVREDALWSPLFQQLTWAHGQKVTGIPSEKTTIINFWRKPGTNRVLKGSATPSADLDAVLSRAGLLDNPSIKVITLIINPLSDSEAKKYCVSPEAKTPYPIGISTNDSVAQMFSSLKLDTHLSSVVLRDGVQLWAGETKSMPSWVLKTATLPNFDKAAFAKEEKERQDNRADMKKVINHALALQKEKKYSEFKKVMGENAPRFRNNSWYACTLAEIRSSEAFEKKQYKEAAKIFDDLLTQFPEGNNMADYITKILSSSDEIKAASYDTMRHALKIMHDANLRCDGGYNAACHEVMMQLAMGKKDYAQAEKDAINALTDLPLVREYADILANQKKGNK